MLEFVSSHYPDAPGVYLMRDARGAVLYVGKAKSLRKRIASYFRQADALPAKTRAMMSRVDEIEVLITGKEKEALLLEASLIKNHSPRYNIVLRDDKSYLLFKLNKQEEYPALTITRRVVRDGSVYFGPFTSALAARNTWKLVNRIFQLRKCSRHVFRNRVRPCLQHQIGRCLAPCVRSVSREEYAAIIKRVELFLSGRTGELLEILEKEMWAASENMEFERALLLRDRMEAVKKTVEEQSVVLNRDRDLDVVGSVKDEDGVSFCVLFIRQGKLVDQSGFFWPEVGDPEQEHSWDMFQEFLVQFYEPGRFVPERIILPVTPDDDSLGEVLSERSGREVRVALARGRQERSLAKLAQENAREFAVKQHRLADSVQLARALGMAEEPWRIEGVDISHLGGRSTYAGQVCFLGGKPEKSEYRLYKFSDEQAGGDDYLALGLWASRRLRQGPPWPDMLLVDGGKGQLGAVENAMKADGKEGLFPVFSIAKSGRSAADLEDRIFKGNRKNPLPVRPGSPELLFLQQVRDETHRFVIGAQRRSRRKQVRGSRLMDFPGIGPKTAKQLLDRFGSLEKVLEATREEIGEMPGFGEKKAAKIYAVLREKGGR
ncbi:MAG: excinuclease ABC subunit UvrC [Desulfovibrionales bacterium]